VSINTNGLEGTLPYLSANESFVATVFFHGKVAPYTETVLFVVVRKCGSCGLE
jgi:hypothetical protein